MSRKTIFEVVSTSVVVVAAVTMVGMQALTVYGQRQREAGPRQYIETWEQDNELGYWMGPKDAEMIVTEFMDLSCPYCAALAPVLDSFRIANPDRVAVVFQHFPLAGKPLSLPAAIALECAGQQGRFREFYLLVYARRAELGTAPAWADLATESGVPDGGAFGSCILQPESSFPRIASGKALGERIGIRGTPTMLINGEVRSIRTFEGLQQELEDLASAR